MSLNLEKLWIEADDGWDWADRLRKVTESEVIGLAVQLLLSKGAEKITSGYPWGITPWVAVKKPGDYLVIPLSILGEQ